MIHSAAIAPSKTDHFAIRDDSKSISLPLFKNPPKQSNGEIVEMDFSILRALLRQKTKEGIDWFTISLRWHADWRTFLLVNQCPVDKGDAARNAFHSRRCVHCLEIQNSDVIECQRPRGSRRDWERTRGRRWWRVGRPVRHNVCIREWSQSPHHLFGFVTIAKTLHLVQVKRQRFVEDCHLNAFHTGSESRSTAHSRDCRAWERFEQRNGEENGILNRKRVGRGKRKRKSEKNSENLEKDEGNK
jgi:hypothetical protein